MILSVKLPAFNLLWKLCKQNRVIINLLKNALEASLEGDVVNIQTNIKDENLIIEVNNKQEMSVEAKHKIFHRSFSSKGLNRRMGTYSIKLLGEKFLKGKVAFISNAINGTTFYLSIPLELKQSIN